jgi:hypothetical protein
MANEITKYDEAWATAAKTFVEREKSGAQTLSLSGGVFKIGEDELPGNKLCVVVLDSVFENSFYDQKWVAGQAATPPKCYAMAHKEDDLAPHPAMEGSEYFEPQATACAGCPKNQFGTSDTGTGKACKNRRRLALIPAGFYEKIKGTKNDFAADIITDEDHYKSADALILKLPVTSGKEYAKFVRKARLEYGRPPYGLVTEIRVEHGGANQFTLKFEVLDVLPNDFYSTIQARHEEAAREIIRPYQEPEASEIAAPKAANRLAGLRKKG